MNKELKIHKDFLQKEMIKLLNDLNNITKEDDGFDSCHNAKLIADKMIVLSEVMKEAFINSNKDLKSILGE
jgi:hypothetical protein